jgi:hypothetical protein
MENLKLIYDFSDHSPSYGTMIFPLLFVLIGIAIFFYHKNQVDKNAISKFGINRRKYGMFFGILFSSFATLISAVVIPSHLSEYSKTKRIFKDKQYQTVQGKVENYHPMPEGGHDTERFSVNGVPFEYSDYDLTDYGYNNAASKGGVIRQGLYVRIGYFNNGTKNVILKLETE